MAAKKPAAKAGTKTTTKSRAKQPPKAKQPTPEAEQPTPEAEQPTPEAEQPTPEAEQPTPEAEQPTPEAEQPTPEAEQPTPEAEQPTPAVEQPDQAAEQPDQAASQPQPWKVGRLLCVNRNLMKGDDVRAVQLALIAAGYSCGANGANGIYGRETAQAVRRFQAFNRLIVDGKVGKYTVKALGGVWDCQQAAQQEPDAPETCKQ